MVTIDFKRYIRDRMWFGVYYDGGFGIRVNSATLGKSKWRYTDWWTLRLWPCLLDGNVVPNWWMAIFNYFGYAKGVNE